MKWIKNVTGSTFMVTLLLLALAPVSQAQWLTQSIDLKAGWNAVFLHVDTSHDTLNELVGADIANPIIEIWQWNPPSATQFIDSPADPVVAAEWSRWLRSDVSSQLQRLAGDTAYLVHVGTNVATYSWTLKGKPVLPRRDWSISGLNLIGFSTLQSSPPLFRDFLAQATAFQSATPEIYYYGGGELSDTNPMLLPSILFDNAVYGVVKRGQAFWVRSGTVFNRYFGPFEIVQSSPDGIDFGENGSSSTFRLRNLTANPLTVTLRLDPSETPPPGQSDIVAVPPLLVRGALNFTNLTYGYTDLPVSSPRTWTLAPRNLPGSEVEVVLGLNRTAITAPPGSRFAGVLSFTDDLGHTQLDMPLSATATSSAGLWVGSAEVTQVGQYLVEYERGTVTNYVSTTAEGEIITESVTDSILTGTNGRYIVSSVNTNLGAVPRAYPLRLIVHNPEAGDAFLLQRVYVGLDAVTNYVIANGESALNPAYLSAARRISAPHLPWTLTNTVWNMGGNLGQSPTLTTTVTLPYDDQASNPFLHTYHPDHDNLDVTFKKVLPQGSESYTVVREITLNIQPPADDFSSIVAGAGTVTGEYLETIALRGIGTSVREYRVSGSFSLNRVLPIPVLTLAP